MPQRTNSRPRYSALPSKRRALALLIFISLNVHSTIAHSRLVTQEVKPQSQANQSRNSVNDQQAQAAFDEGTRLCGKGDAQSLQLAIPKFEEAAKRFHALDNRQMEASSYGWIGFIFTTLNEKQKASEFFNHALLIFKDLGDRNGEAMALVSIAAVYSDLGDKQKALTYYNQSLLIFKELGDRSLQATTLNNIGVAYSELGDKEKALAYLTQVLPIRKELGDRNGEATTLNNIGLLYYNTKLRIKMRLNDWRSTCASITSSYKPSHFHVQLDII
jgi:tetratricopeptide (TPR) repeat protein